MLARCVNNLQGRTGSRMLLVNVTCRSQISSASHKVTDNTRRQITYAEFQANLEPASWKHAVKASVANKISKVPGTSILAHIPLDEIESFLRSGLPWYGKLFGMPSSPRLATKAPIGMLRPQMSDVRCPMSYDGTGNILEPKDPAPCRSLAHNAPNYRTQSKSCDDSEAIPCHGFSVLVRRIRLHEQDRAQCKTATAANTLECSENDATYFSQI